MEKDGLPAGLASALATFGTPLREMLRQHQVRVALVAVCNAYFILYGAFLFVSPPLINYHDFLSFVLGCRILKAASRQQWLGMQQVQLVLPLPLPLPLLLLLLLLLLCHPHQGQL